MTNPNNKSQIKNPNHNLRRAVAAGLVGTITLAAYAIVNKLTETKSPNYVAGTEYLVKSGNDAWAIVEKAKIGMDTREAVDKIDASLPDDTFHAGHYLQPGDKIVFKGHPKLKGKPVLISSSVENQMPAVVPIFPGKLEPKNYGTIAEGQFEGNTVIMPNLPPPLP